MTANEPSTSAADLSVGDVGPTIVVEDLDRTDFVRYAGASGDFTPLHFNEPYTTEAGFDQVFAQGMLIAGIASRFVTDWFGIERIRRYETRFEDQIWPGETVVVEGIVSDIRTTTEGRIIDVDFEVATETDRVVLTGFSTAVFLGAT